MNNMLCWGIAAFVLVLLLGKDKYESLCVGVCFPLFLLFLPLLGILTGYLCPSTLDGALRTADLRLGLDGFALSRWTIRHGAYFLVPPVYAALPVVIAAGWLLSDSKAALLRAAVLGAALAFVCYLLVPACGPRYAFSNFPGAGSLISIGSFVPRDCFPSMHVTWALLVALNASRWRWLFVLYALLMMVATVASGEHYFVDVIAAIPFCFAVRALAAYRFPVSQSAEALP